MLQGFAKLILAIKLRQRKAYDLNISDSKCFVVRVFYHATFLVSMLMNGVVMYPSTSGYLALSEAVKTNNGRGLMGIDRFEHKMKLNSMFCSLSPVFHILIITMGIFFATFNE